MKQIKIQCKFKKFQSSGFDNKAFENTSELPPPYKEEFKLPRIGAPVTVADSAEPSTSASALAVNNNDAIRVTAPCAVFNFYDFKKCLT